MTIESIALPKYVPNKDMLTKFIHWLDYRFKIEECVNVKARRYSKEVVWGWCQPCAHSGNIDVVVNTTYVEHIDDYLETLAHEFVHVDQHDKDRYVFFEGKYDDNPNEIEAWGFQSRLVQEFLSP